MRDIDIWVDYCNSCIFEKKKLNFTEKIGNMILRSSFTLKGIQLYLKFYFGLISFSL